MTSTPDDQDRYPQRGPTPGPPSDPSKPLSGSQVVEYLPFATRPAARAAALGARAVPAESVPAAFDAHPPRMSWRSETPDLSTQLLVVRHAFKAGHGFAPHTHEFAEVFWCESGSGLHHINGQTIPLEAGDVVFMRPE
nr:AraC family ligand binding domain-containing protein [Planctomycetota bacterium]